MANKPATKAQVQALGALNERGHHNPLAYLHKEPNRRQRREEIFGRENTHNNRKSTNGRQTSYTPVMQLVHTGRYTEGKGALGRVPIFDKVPTGHSRSIRQQNYWRYGGNNVPPGGIR